ncbi:hypothetical protein FNV43_RR13162 [Rhamnella rubrinervis]|uniref:Uncharacterized protein n=1 Tax=Rhamnella rubrinervis TaxID=2594499 RepID=A0A8K0MER7_9ROSA|nr:hypothetical protein FNV43_RR13162 [Rhamnella rubrinervis]
MEDHKFAGWWLPRLEEWWVGRDMSSDTARENASVVDSSLRDMSSDTARENASVVDSSLTEWKQDEFGHVTTPSNLLFRMKRPDINAAFMREEAQGKETIVAGFYHEGYEEPLLMLMKRRAVHSGLVVKIVSGTPTVPLDKSPTNTFKLVPYNHTVGVPEPNTSTVPVKEALKDSLRIAQG